MPHSLFLGSALATQDRVSKPSANLNISSFRSTIRTPRDLLYSLWNIIKSGFRVRRMEEKLTEAKCHAEHDNRPHDVVQAHLYHGMVDVVFSLLGFAVIINSL
jgi:metal iron transporter